MFDLSCIDLVMRKAVIMTDSRVNVFNYLDTDKDVLFRLYEYPYDEKNDSFWVLRGKFGTLLVEEASTYGLIVAIAKTGHEKARGYIRSQKIINLLL